MRSLFPRLTVVLLALAVFALRAPAADKEKPAFYNQVTAVDPAAKSVTVYHSPTKSITYTATGDTKVTIDHKPGKVEDIKPGMKIIMVNHKPDSNEAESISAESVKPAKGMGKR